MQISDEIHFKIERMNFTNSVHNFRIFNFRQIKLKFEPKPLRSIKNFIIHQKLTPISDAPLSVIICGSIIIKFFYFNNFFSSYLN